MKTAALILCLLPIWVAGQTTQVQGLFNITSTTTATGTPPQSGTGAVTVTVTFASPPTSPTAVYPALFADFGNVFSFAEDDNLTGVRDVYKMTHGGLASDGTTYPGLTFNDGAGKLLKFTGSIAVNARSNFNNGALPGTSGKLTLAELATMVSNGYTLENHGFYHEPTGNFFIAATATASQAGGGVAQNQAYYYSQMLTQGIEQLMRVAVVPSNHPGYFRGADSLHYLATTSTQALDGYTGFPTNTGLNTANNGGNFLNVDTAPLSATSSFGTVGFMGVLRNFNDTWSTQSLRSQIADMVAKSSPTKHLEMHLGSHAIVNPFTLLNYIDSIGQGRKIWVTSTQQHLEYHEAKRLTVKSQSLTGNVLTITLDQSAIPPQNRWRNLSLLITGGTITSITASGGGIDDYTANPTYATGVGLLNLYKEKKTGFPVPQ